MLECNLWRWSGLPQLREEYDQGVDMQMEEEQCVHDVAALLKEFLRDMPDPLLTRELYTAFINTTCEDPSPLATCFQLGSVIVSLRFHDGLDTYLRVSSCKRHTLPPTQ